MSLLDYIFPKKIESGIVPNWEVSADEEGAVHIRRVAEPVRRSIYSQDDPSPVVRIASRFLVEVLPGSATLEEHQAWFLVARINAMSVVNAMKSLTDVTYTDFTIMSDVDKLAAQIDKDSITWENFLAVASLPVELGLKITVRQLRSLILYAFQVADAGWGAHMGDMPSQLIADGVVTAEELEADYMRRIAIYQAVFAILTNEETRFLMTGETPSLSGPEVALIVAGAVVSIATVVSICFCIYSAYQTYSMNAVFERQADECRKQFIATGQESEMCKQLPEKWAAAVTKNPANIIADDLTTYAVVAGGIALGIIFLPEIMASIRTARSEGRAAEREARMASNRGRRRLRS